MKRQPVVVLLSLLPLAGGVPAASHIPTQPLSALAPVELVANGFKEPAGIVVAQDDTVYVSDRKAGTIIRITSDGRKVVFLGGLKKPTGLALDLAGRLLIAEEKTGRILRREPSGALTTLASGIKRPRWLAIGDEGPLYLSAKGLRRDHRDDNDDEGDEEHPRGDVILRLGANGTLTIFAAGFKGLQGIALRGQTLYAVTERRQGEREQHGSTLVRIPIQLDGGAGPLEVLVQSELRYPMGLALDRLGAVYFTAERRHGESDRSRKGVVSKWPPDGRLVPFSTGLEEPRGIAFEGDGSLLLAEGEEHRRRLLRFRAPSAPALDPVPAFTNQSPLAIAGTTEAEALLDGIVNETWPSTTTLADGTGRFALDLALTPNAESQLAVFATAHQGRGLTGAPAEMAILHDDQPPGVTILQPLGGAFVRQTVTLQAQASDGGSGVASLAFTVDGRTLATFPNPDPTQPFTGSHSLNTTTVTDGTHTLAATATDRTGNFASTHQALIVDNTPPDTQLTGGPAGEISETTATFTWTGTDNLTPLASLQFAWRLDSGSWSSFSSDTTAALSNLSEGPHNFEVKARDLAGNEDPTPATRGFTVVRLSIQITAPSEGTTLSGDRVLVQGTVQGSGEVGVTVNGVPAQVSGTVFAALVSLTSGPNTLTAVATDSTGRTASHAVAVTVTEAPEPSLLVHAIPAAGLAPLSVTFSLTSLSAATLVELDLEGDGRVDFTGASLEGQTFSYPQPGLYLPTVVATDAQGQRRTASAIVQVYDRASLDALLQAKWTALKDALRAGDLARALTFIHGDTREAYRSQLGRFSPATLAGIDAYMTMIQLVEVGAGGAQYEMLRQRDGQTLSFGVWFQVDGDGLWRLRRF